MSIADTTNKFSDCNPTTNYDKSTKNSNGTTVSLPEVDGGYTDWMCFQIKHVKFASNSISINGSGVLQTVEISGNFYITNCKKGTLYCDGLYSNGLGLFLDNGPFRDAGMTDPDSSSECIDFKSNYIPADGEKYLKIGNPTILPDSNSSNFWVQKTTGPFSITIPIYIPANCQSGSYHISFFWGSDANSGWDTLVGVPGNQMKVIQKSNLPVVGVSCRTIGTFSTTSKGETVVCAKLNGKILWAVVGGTSSQKPIPSAQKNVVPSGPVVGSTCSKPGQTQVYKSSKFACVLSGKKYKWILISQPTSNSNNQSNNQQTNGSNNISQADVLKNSGCSKFPSAVIALQQATTNVNSALTATQLAGMDFYQASMIDSKYASLYTAANTIWNYVKSNNKWAGGSGYFGDINTVRMAMDTVNMACGSHIYLS